MKNKFIYALGVFDGVHLAHRELLKACTTLARFGGCMPGVVTFDTHPDGLITGNTPKLLNTVQQRKRLLEDCQIGQVLVLPFDEQRRQQPWQAFLEQLMQEGAAGFVCGDDFRFGFRGEGNAEKLEQFCREKDLFWSVVPAWELDGVRISSTHIRGLIERGQMEEAVRFLGHPHLISGTVVEGRRLGRTIGVPTANLLLPEEVVMPAAGVYACRAEVDGQQYMAVTNVGSRPTVGGHRITVEPWILDFEGDLYGKELRLLFYKFLRPEVKFESLEALRQEILKNAEQTRKIFENM